MSTYTIHRILVGGAPGFAVVESKIVHGSTEPVPGPLIGQCRTIGIARSLVPREADACFMRSPEDHPSVVETWM